MQINTSNWSPRPKTITSLVALQSGLITDLITQITNRDYLQITAYDSLSQFSISTVSTDVHTQCDNNFAPEAALHGLLLATGRLRFPAGNAFYIIGTRNTAHHPIAIRHLTTDMIQDSSKYKRG